MVVFSLLYYFIGLCDPAVPLGSLGLVKEKRMNHESAGESSDCRDSKQDRNPIFQCVCSCPCVTCTTSHGEEAVTEDFSRENLFPYPKAVFSAAPVLET